MISIFSDCVGFPITRRGRLWAGGGMRLYILVGLFGPKQDFSAPPASGRDDFR